jgi:hypothetical protein
MNILSLPFISVLSPTILIVLSFFAGAAIGSKAKRIIIKRFI